MSEAPDERLKASGAIRRDFTSPAVIPLPRAPAPADNDTKEKVPDFSPTPFAWRDPALIPPRQWLYGKHLIRKFLSVTVAPGGIGKSSLTIAEAVSMAIGRGLLGTWVAAPLKVWLWNLEDPQEELDRRFAATMIHHGVSPGDIGDRLYVDTGRIQGLCTAVQARDGAKIVAPVMERLEAEIKRLGIDVLIVDPFVSSHQVSENDNNAIDLVAKAWAGLADRCNIAVELVHHTRKASGEAEATAESARGAKALVDASRDTRTLNRMTPEEATSAQVENNRLFFRVFSDKSNLAPPADKSDWYELKNVELSNGDHVGVVASWTWPDAFEGVTLADLVTAQKAVRTAGERNRQSPQASEWVGHVIGAALQIETGYGVRGAAHLTPQQKSGRMKVTKLLSAWISNGAFVIDNIRDEKGTPRPVVIVGEVASA